MADAPGQRWGKIPQLQIFLGQLPWSDPPGPGPLKEVGHSSWIFKHHLSPRKPCMSKSRWLPYYFPHHCAMNLGIGRTWPWRLQRVEAKWKRAEMFQWSTPDFHHISQINLPFHLKNSACRSVWKWGHQHLGRHSEEIAAGRLTNQ